MDANADASAAMMAGMAQGQARALRECADCGLFQTLPALAAGASAHCLRCDATLRRCRPDPLNRVLACTMAAAALMLLAIRLPFLTIDAAGRITSTDLFTGPEQLAMQGMGELGVLVLACTVLLPAAKLLLTLTVLLSLRGTHPPAFIPRLFGWLERLKPWSMIEVYLLGVFVAYTRLTAIAAVEVGPALYALGGVMLAMVAADAALDPDAVWEEIARKGLSVGTAAGTALRPGAKPIGCLTCGLVSHVPEGAGCPRCGRALRRRKAASLGRTTALLLAAAIFYVPANVLPVLTLIRLGQGAPSTILGGVQELIDARMWPLAALVFLASITVPVLKLASLAWMLVATRMGSGARLRDRTRLYRLVDVIGRWSMIDVFMISILVALVRMGFLANVTPDSGAVCFAAVVVLTMFAAASFDPRLMWDRGRPAPAPAPGLQPA